ncbi:uncharacterized protein BDV17DRAFT_251258 [Aspergillus undulatus]|uniref:uncharacterized protein n=1 Tax=Aspergillus undulatus TaxID=1810928 RepID=UPI003CCE06D9
MVDIYTLLSNENIYENESLYSSYLGLVPDFNVGFAILSADTVRPADLNAHTDIIGDVMLSALMGSAIQSATERFGGEYKAIDIDSLRQIHQLCNTASVYCRENRPVICEA